jgi:Meiotically up-regulated gene 113
MSYVYAFRRGNEDEFKFGRTANLDQRRKSLQTGSSKPLILFDSIETEDDKEGERFILRHLAHKRLVGEFCAVTVDEAREAMQVCRVYLERQLPIWRAEEGKVAELNGIESSPEMLHSTEDLSEKYQQLLQLRAKKRLMEIDLERMGDQEARLEIAIKLAIGSAKGIDGVATWETGDSRRKFDSDILKSADPELYEMYLTEFDQRRFREERSDVYASYQRTHRVRQFRLIE